VANLTLLEIESEVQYNLGSDTDEESARIRRWIKSGYEFITFPNIYPHPELEHSETIALVAGSTQTTTALWNKVELVRYYQVPLASVATNQPGWRLHPTSFRMLEERNHLTEKEPRRYAFRANTFLLDAFVATGVTGNGLKVAGYRKPAALDYTSDTETTDLREEWDQILIYAATMHGFTSKGQTDKALGMREMAAKLINDMPPIQQLSAEDWDDEMSVSGGPGSYAGGGMRRGRGR
jgi:hypothetical protein